VGALIWGALAGGLVAYLAHRFLLLTAGGGLTAFALGVVVFGYGGWMWAAPMLIFFVLSSALSKVGAARKQCYDQVFEKGNRRDVAQVLANGGVAGAIAGAYALTENTALFPLYCAALAAAAADTWATELGTLWRGMPRLITTLKKVPSGTSGGISPPGLLGACLGAASVALCGWAFYGGWQTAAAVAFCGLLGSLLDSVLGATVQSMYRCAVCGQTTERRNHCGQPGTRISGWAWMNNDWVNAVSIAGAVGIAICVFSHL